MDLLIIGIINTNMFKKLWEKIKKFWKWILGGVAIASVGGLMFMGGPVEPISYGQLLVYVGQDVSGSFKTMR